MESFQRLEFLLSHSEDLSPLTLSEPAVLSALKRLNPMKAAGLDGVVWWRRTQASLLAQLAVQKSSFAEQRRPSSWKMAPVPKLKPVIDINKYLRPISLTSVISKLAQDFVVALHFGPAALEVIDPNQYGRITASSTPHALTYMVHVPGCKPPMGLGLLWESSRLITGRPSISLTTPYLCAKFSAYLFLALLPSGWPIS